MQDSYLSTKIGTLGGTMAAVVPAIHQDSLISTAVLAVLGAAVSFVVSLTLNVFLKERITRLIMKIRGRQRL